jgi:hypothetical protein
MILLALSLGLPQGVAVLCASPDGHVAIEFAAGPQAADDACGCAEACGSCRDVQVGLDGSVFRPSPSRLLAVPPADCVGPVPETVAVTLPALRLLAGGPAAPLAASPPLLRSVVLLI